MAPAIERPYTIAPFLFVIGLVALLSSCPGSDPTPEPEFGTITVRLTGATEHNGKVFFYTVGTSGGDDYSAGQSIANGSIEDTINNHDTVPQLFLGGEVLSVRGYIDVDDNGGPGDPPTGGVDFASAWIPYIVDGDIIVDFVYPDDFELSQDGSPLLLLIYNGSYIDSGGTVYLGESAINISRTMGFSIENAGTALLNLTGASIINKSGAHADCISILTEPAAAVSPGEQTSFTILLTPLVTGELEISLNIQFNDVYSSPFTFDLDATSIVPPVNIPKTGQTKIYANGDDGDLQLGAEWPEIRFVDNSDGTTTDMLTGLMWETAPASTQADWEYALNYANNLTVGGYDDWHLANVNELMSLMNAEEPNSATWLNGQLVFSGIISDEYWTSTRLSSLTGSSYAWIGECDTGLLYGLGPPNFAKAYRWAVRYAGGGAIEIPKTGKSTKYRTGDDGDLELGATWPSQRFVDCGNGIMADNLTGLMWEQNTDATVKTWADALEYAKDLTLGGYSDWRLPNKNELRSLLNYEEDVVADWLGYRGFQNVQEEEYWTSTTYASSAGSAWTVIMLAGHLYYADKSAARFVWAVRGGD